MKKIALLLLLISISFCSFSQESKKEEEKIKKIYIGADFFDDIWLDAPDGMDISYFNRGSNVFALYNFPLKKSNFIFGVGLGISSHNLYSNSYPVLDEDGNTAFSKISDIALDEKDDYKNNKINITYLDIPMDLRFNTKKGFKYSIGIKGSLKLSDHTKYKGDDFKLGTDNDIKIKEFNVNGISNNRIGITARFGYKWINLYGYYSITKLFEDGSGPEMYPISFGISITPNK